MSEFSLYIVDDETSLAKGIALILGNRYRTRIFFSAHTVLNALEKKCCDLLLLDIGLPDMNGIEVLKIVKKKYPDTAVIMITAFDQVQTVVSAMKAGAQDYVVKPVQPDSLSLTVENAIDTIRLRKEIRDLQEKYLRENLPFFIGESRKTQNIMELVQKVAASPDTPVLILGESGTGKELIAGAIHYRSPRFKGPLVSINCAAIPENLVESELFGYEKGAYTGAAHRRIGKTEQAHGGTVFLDEIGDMPLPLQSKILRLIQKKSIERLGGRETIPTDVRIIAATNRNLENAISEGLFREDLYYRLKVVTIRLPPLRERPGDISLLQEHFLSRYAAENAVVSPGISKEAVRMLNRYPWPGNVRELANIIQKVLIFNRGAPITEEDIFQSINEKDGIIPEVSEAREQELRNYIRKELAHTDNGNLYESCMNHFSSLLIREALNICGGNRSHAAKLLGISRPTLHSKIEKYGIKLETAVKTES